MLCYTQAPVILGAVTIFGILSWYFIPADKWLRREQVLRALQVADEETFDAGSSAVNGNLTGEARYRAESNNGKMKDSDMD